MREYAQVQIRYFWVNSKDARQGLEMWKLYMISVVVVF